MSLVPKKLTGKKLPAGFRIKIILLVVALGVYYFSLSMTFSFFTSTDKVSNRLLSKNIGLELFEPAWDAGGKTMAAASEPGMVIPKDPYAKNSGEMDMLVRLRLELRLAPGDSQQPQGDTYIKPANETERKLAILKALLDDKDNTVLTVTPATDDSAKGNATVVTGQDGNRYYLRYNNTKTDSNENEYSSFLIESNEEAGSESFDLNFYYIAGNPIGGVGQYVYDDDNLPLEAEHTQMAVLKPGVGTPKLFSGLVCPIYKKDYLTVFDQSYTINVYAEGILLKEFEEKGIPGTIENFKQLASA